jgi:hypothetical protein
VPEPAEHNSNTIEEDLDVPTFLRKLKK